jgi:hypothetical protein
MTKLAKVFEQGDYSVIVSRDGAQAMIVQLVKTTTVRYRELDGSETSRPTQQAIETISVYLEDKKGEVRNYDELDKELETRISELSRRAKSMATKEALGNNLLNKVTRKYDGSDK